MEKDFKDVLISPNIIREILIAVSGHHNVLLMGPPGAGKTIVASRIPSIMPEMSVKEKEENINLFKSIWLYEDADEDTFKIRPFRSPHHTISYMAMFGKKNERPGEIALSRYGVLHMDEASLFKKAVLESLEYCPEVLMVFSTGKCKCGMYPHKNCTCSEDSREKFINAFPQKFLNLSDIWIDFPLPSYQEIQNYVPSSSEDLKSQVSAVWSIQKKRYEHSDIKFNAEICGEKFYADYMRIFEHNESVYAKERALNEGFSVLDSEKTARISRTIADLKNNPFIQVKDFEEAKDIVKKGNMALLSERKEVEVNEQDN